jgi:protein-tyrosine phosphatase
MTNILFICIGNICRSPIAEGLFKQALPGKAVCSAGISALVGEPADPLSIQLMREHGIDISAHRAKSLAAWMVKEADLIVTMDQNQRRFIEHAYPASRGKVMRLGEYGRYDVPDPYQQDMAVFRHSCNLIARGIDELVERMERPRREASQYVVQAIRESPLPFPP